LPCTLASSSEGELSSKPLSSLEELELVTSELDLYVLVRLFSLILRDALLGVLLSPLRLDEIRRIDTSWDSSAESNSKVRFSQVSLEWILGFVSGSFRQQEVPFAVKYAESSDVNRSGPTACESVLPGSEQEQAVHPSKLWIFHRLVSWLQWIRLGRRIRLSPRGQDSSRGSCGCNQAELHRSNG